MRRKGNLSHRPFIGLRRAARDAVFGMLICAPLLGVAPAAKADEPVWATGHVTDADGRPVVGAMVAAYDDNNHVVDYARTDRNGDYALAVPQRALHIEHRHGQGFIAEVFGGVTRFVGDSVGFMANPVQAGVHAVTSAEAATVPDPITRGEFAVGGAILDKTLFGFTPKARQPLDKQDRKQPGAMVIKVIAPDHNDLVSVTHTYWVEDEFSRLAGKQKRTTAAWLDPIQLTPVGSEKPSKVEADFLQFTAARLMPSLAEPGQTVHIVARLKTPADPNVHLVVVARDDRTGEKWELHSTGDGLYSGEFQVDRRFPKDDQVICILAYAALEQKPGRRLDAEKAIEGAGLWSHAKPYVYDPLLAASRNRAELTLTVIAPAKSQR